jgi:hypothetical protein
VNVGIYSVLSNNNHTGESFLFLKIALVGLNCYLASVGVPVPSYSLSKPLAWIPIESVRILCRNILCVGAGLIV